MLDLIDTIDFELELFAPEKHTSVDDFILRARGKVASIGVPTLKKTIFPAEETKIKYKTLENMPLNVNHMQEEIIGSVTKTSLVYPDASPPEVWIETCIWDFLKPHIGKLIQQAKKLAFSVEIYSEFAVCPSCGKEIPYVQWKSGIDLCDHLKENDLRYYKDFVFLGCALLLPPAKPAVPDAKAELLKFDFSAITMDYLRKLSDEELIKLHKELHDEFKRTYGERINNS